MKVSILTPLDPKMQALRLLEARYDVLFCGFQLAWLRPPVQFYMEPLGINGQSWSPKLRTPVAILG